MIDQYVRRKRGQERGAYDSEAIVRNSIDSG
jgi:hypothetical protein